jgi:hypothetical protein
MAAGGGISIPPICCTVAAKNAATTGIYCDLQGKDPLGAAIS